MGECVAASRARAWKLMLRPGWGLGISISCYSAQCHSLPSHLIAGPNPKLEPMGGYHWFDGRQREGGEER